MARRVEPYLTFLDAASLSATAADTQGKLEEMQKHHEEEISAIKADLGKKIEMLQTAFMTYQMMTTGKVDLEAIKADVLAKAAAT